MPPETVHTSSVSLAVFHPMFYTGTAISHICLSLCEFMQSPSLTVRLVAPAGVKLRKSFLTYAIPRPLPSLFYRAGLSTEALSRMAGRRFLRSLRPQEVVYLWPGSPLWLYEEVKSRGHVLVMERINCHRMTALRILNEAYIRARLQPAHGMTPEDVRRETEQASLADFIFSPSPNVERSLRDAGVPNRKILPASYGWEPSRVGYSAPLVAEGDEPNVLFLGRLCIRKGVHLLLDAWSRVESTGKLLLAGALDDDVSAIKHEQLVRSNVMNLGFQPDIAPLLSSASIFAFPTLEEGSPLVVYEAMAAGLAIVTTTMGGGEVVRDGIEGVILDAYDSASWVDTLGRLAKDPDRVAAMGAAARVRAAEFTWARAGRRRERVLLAALEARVGSV